MTDNDEARAIIIEQATTLRDETINGQCFSIQSKRYEKRHGHTGWQWRAFYRIDGKIVARDVFLRRRKLARRLTEHRPTTD